MCWLLVIHRRQPTLFADQRFVFAYCSSTQIKNPFMGWAKFRAGFVGDDSNEWSVSASDSFLKSHEETNFVLRYTPHRPGVSNAYFVIETEVRQIKFDVFSLFVRCIISSVILRRISPRLGRLSAALESMRSPTICK